MLQKKHTTLSVLAIAVVCTILGGYFGQVAREEQSPVHAQSEPRVMRDPAGGPSGEITRVHLVGNSCRMPLVREMFVETFPKLAHCIEHDVDEAKAAVAKGACLAEYLTHQVTIGDDRLVFHGMAGKKVTYVVGRYGRLYCNVFGFNVGADFAADNKSNGSIIRRCRALPFYI